MSSFILKINKWKIGRVHDWIQILLLRIQCVYWTTTLSSQQGLKLLVQRNLQSTCVVSIIVPCFHVNDRESLKIQ